LKFASVTYNGSKYTFFQQCKGRKRGGEREREKKSARKILKDVSYIFSK